MHHYAITDPKGRITQTMSVPYLLLRCDESVRDDTHYADVSTGEIHSKRPLEMDQEIEGLTVTLAGLPAGLSVTANGMATVTDDDPLVITFDVPGTYSIELTGHVEYLDRVEEVTVGDP